jgi:hypothetical protein
MLDISRRQNKGFGKMEPKGYLPILIWGRGCSSMVERQPSKLMTTVRFALTRSINSPSVAGLKLMAKELQQ